MEIGTRVRASKGAKHYLRPQDYKRLRDEVGVIVSVVPDWYNDGNFGVKFEGIDERLFHFPARELETV